MTGAKDVIKVNDSERNSSFRWRINIFRTLLASIIRTKLQIQCQKSWEAVFDYKYNLKKRIGEDIPFSENIVGQRGKEESGMLL